MILNQIKKNHRKKKEIIELPVRLPKEGYLRKKRMYLEADRYYRL